MRYLTRRVRRIIADAYWSDPLQAYDEVFRLAGEKSAIDAGYVTYYDPREYLLKFAYVIDQQVVVEARTVPLGDGPTSWVVKNQSSLLQNDPVDPRHTGGVSFGVRRRSGSQVHEPMISDIPVPRHPVLGVLSFQAYRADAFDPEFLAWTEEVATHLANLRVGIRNEQKLMYALDNLRQRTRKLTHAVGRIMSRAEVLQEDLLNGAPPEAVREEVLHLLRRLGGLPIGDLKYFSDDTEEVEPEDFLPVLHELSEREREVALRISLPSKAIASALGITEHTVAFHLKSIYRKLNVQSKAEAAAVLNQWTT